MGGKVGGWWVGGWVGGRGDVREEEEFTADLNDVDDGAAVRLPAEGLAADELDVPLLGLDWVGGWVGVEKEERGWVGRRETTRTYPDDEDVPAKQAVAVGGAREAVHLLHERGNGLGLEKEDAGGSHKVPAQVNTDSRASKNTQRTPIVFLGRRTVEADATDVQPPTGQHI